MKNIILLLSTILLFINACTQTRIVQKVYGFVQHKNFGTIAVDANGNQLTPGSQTTLNIYLETNGESTPIVNKVTYNNITYKNPIISFEGKKSINIGSNKSNGKAITITPAHGNALWKMEIICTESKTENSTTLHADNTNSSLNKIVIEGKKNGKIFKISTDNIIELAPFEGL